MMHVEPIAERLAKLSELPIHRGSHDSFDGGHCAMELVSWIAGEPWSHRPSCVCPVLTAFVVGWNDGLSSKEDRTRILRPFLPRLLDTRGSRALENRRATMAGDWFVRVNAPARLRLAGLTQHADVLASLPEITDFAEAPALMPALDAAQRDAAAKRATAGVWAIEWATTITKAAARATEWATAGVWDAALVAARDAAWTAAWAAAREQTVEHLQRSASDLLSRMIDAA